MLRVREVRNFEWWERLVAAEEVPVQDLGEEEPQQDCFGMLVAKETSCSVTSCTNQIVFLLFVVSVKGIKGKNISGIIMKKKGGVRNVE